MTRPTEARPTEKVRQWLNQLLERNERTAGAEVAEMYLGKDIFVAQLRRPVVIEGQWRDEDKTADIFDLMDEHAREGR